ncbi:hypothetical protein DFH07DRAFT_160099 [Mycena maculata]|uniref:ADP-ribosylation factor n=1 Tax=Mycena maculata TaxID=230809 RepID=A0AAD7I016_9AGAR|nr:hypothetical protein DFH07DRAFT_160099 [Mycena maculata]
MPSSHVPPIRGSPEHFTRKEAISVIIIGLDGAGKTTLLGRIKTQYNETPGLTPDKIGSHSRPKHGNDHSAINDTAVLGPRRPAGYTQYLAQILRRLPRRRVCHRRRGQRTIEGRMGNSVLSAPQILNIPLLLIANKQDSPQALSVEEIRHDYDWHQRKARRGHRQLVLCSYLYYAGFKRSSSLIPLADFRVCLRTPHGPSGSVHCKGGYGMGTDQDLQAATGKSIRT